MLVGRDCFPYPLPPTISHRRMGVCNETNTVLLFPYSQKPFFFYPVGVLLASPAFIPKVPSVIQYPVGFFGCLISL